MKTSLKETQASFPYIVMLVLNPLSFRSLWISGPTKIPTQLASNKNKNFLHKFFKQSASFEVVLTNSFIKHNFVC